MTPSQANLLASCYTTLRRAFVVSPNIVKLYSNCASMYHLFVRLIVRLPRVTKHLSSSWILQSSSGIKPIIGGFHWHVLEGSQHLKSSCLVADSVTSILWYGWRKFFYKKCSSLAKIKHCCLPIYTLNPSTLEHTATWRHSFKHICYNNSSWTYEICWFTKLNEIRVLHLT